MTFRTDGRRNNRNRALRSSAVLLLAFAALLPMAHADTKKKKAVAPPVDITKLVWPSPPEQVRVRFLNQYRGEMELLGKKQVKGTMLDRIAGVSIAPEERPRMNKPYGVAADSKGRIFVADSSQNMVFVFDIENKKLEFRGDNAPANFQVPIGVAVDELDRVFVSDSKAHEITCFDSKGRVERIFGADVLVRPAGLAVDDPLHRLYVVDVGGRRIAVFDLQTLKFQHYIGEAKDGQDRAGWLTNPNSIAVDPDGLIYVTDAVIARVVVFDTEGNFVRAWGKHGDGPGMLGRPKGIAIDPDGHVYVADAQLNRLQAFSPEGTPLISVGSNGWGPAQFVLMGGVTIDRQNRIIVVDQLPPRIEIFRYITDEEAAAAKKAGVPEIKRQQPAKQDKPVEAEAKAGSVVTKEAAAAPAAPAAPAGPTIEELQKELADLKAKLAGQSQAPDAAKTGVAPVQKPDAGTQSSPK